MDGKRRKELFIGTTGKLIYHKSRRVHGCPVRQPERSDMKKELFELRRNMRIELCNITKITGYIVDNDRNCRLEFVKNFLNLEETETFKYLDILKKFYLESLEEICFSWILRRKQESSIWPRL